ncbi:galactoside alpha-(1,2)-fucosyltransferase 2-like [Saccostrea echinata]|uniref:galactoside alpha-(1,2)-fucosyltransferase 2-like n=1 Tax=Saccostrea echinata TaxID=191078 RepID=UPI002A805D53|nr:galactoside alpha-(1,2)-fucosyltransferase 2-like [Saccostrea echinata]
MYDTAIWAPLNSSSPRYRESTLIGKHFSSDLNISEDDMKNFSVNSKRYTIYVVATLFATVLYLSLLLSVFQRKELVNYFPSFHLKLIASSTTKEVLSDATKEVSTSPNTANTLPITTKFIFSDASKTNSLTEIYVCPTFEGRLGNNLFQFASGFGIAVSKGLKFVIGEKDRVYKMLQLKNSKHLLISKDKKECIKAKVRIERRMCSYDDQIGNFTPNATFRVGNYLQSWKYFHNASRELREQFKIWVDLQKKVDHIIKVIVEKFNTTRKNVTLIAIHNRRGDYLSRYSNGYNVATKEYFEKAMKFFSNYSNPLYIVCSNDYKWSRANIPRNYKVEFILGNLPEVDLTLMASCDHMISSVGTYSWWASWFNKGKVTYYKWPARERSGLRVHFSSDYMDYFYPHWIGL